MSSAQDVLELSRSFLGGERGRAVVLRVFLDESGIHEAAPICAVAAYMDRPKTWKAWTKEWNRKKKPIKVFHAVDCANFRGEFEGWTKPQRDKFVAKLLPIIPKHDMLGWVIAIHMDDFREALKGREELLELFATPYGACFQWIITIILRTIVEYGRHEQVAFVHETNDFKQEALQAFDYVEKTEPYGSKITLSFGSKEKYPPLQAADVLAYEGAKFLKNPTGRIRRAFEVLDPERKSITAKRYAKDQMPILLSVLEKFARMKRESEARLS